MDIFKDSNGTLWPYPPSYEEAERIDHLKYIGFCPECDQKTAHFTEAKACKWCLHRSINEFFLAVRNCETFFEEAVPVSAQEAREMGLDYYYTWECCDRGPHPFKKEIKTGRCMTCRDSQMKNLRAAARAKGALFYIPSKKCPTCKTRTKRAVDTDQCQKCIEPIDYDTLVMESSPELVISRPEAKALGWGVYRTGVPCKRGHQGFRYVSSTNCIECHKLRGKK